MLEEEPGVPEPTDPVALLERRAATSASTTSGSSTSRALPVLPDLDLTVPAGQTVALVGTTGAGKTTIAKLATRFYDPIGGAVTLDGVDLRSLTSTDLHRAVVMVTQENYLFSGTIADNIRFGRPDATEDDVEAATRGARRPRVHRRAAAGLRHRGLQPAAGCSAPASASWSPSPAPSWPTPRC